MKRKKARAVLFASISGLTLLVSLWTGLSWVQASGPSATASLDRPEDPVIVPGAALPALLGSPIDELRLSAYDMGGWSAIPFQIDERTNDITGTYVAFEDGLLDDNDEVVFMAKDAAGLAGADWPDDAEARQNARYLLAASDPLSPGDMAWTYLFRSATLPASPDTYVNWNFAAQTVTAISYTASFSPDDFIGLSNLEINGNGIDVLDRQKIRVETLLVTLNEEDLAGLITATIDIPVVGAVRGVANGSAFNVSIYGAQMLFHVLFDTSAVPLNIDEIRTSLDLNDPAITGITSYFNSSGANVPIDGSPDAVSSTPVISWYQESGQAGGMVVSLPLIDPGGGTAENYYKDDSTIDPGDTGDGRSYGDAGLVVVDPGSLIEFALVTSFLPPGTTGNVGAQYYERIVNPLQVTASVQYYGQGVYLPVVLKPA